MRGQLQASTARLGSIPARERLAVWADARVRKRRADQVRAVERAARLAAERRRALRAGPTRTDLTLRRLPY